MEKKNIAVQIPKELSWLFRDDEKSRKEREAFVNDFFGLDKIDEILNNNCDEKKEGY